MELEQRSSGAPGTALLLAVALLTLYMWQCRRWVSRRRELRLPPGPRPWPVLGNLTSLQGSGTGRLEVDLAALSLRHGPLMWLRLGTQNTLVVNSPDMARIVLRDQDSVFAGRSPPKHGLREVLGAFDVFAPHSRRWKKDRTVAQTELFSPSRVTNLQPRRSRDIAEVMCSVRDLVLAASDEGTPATPALPFRNLAMGLLLNVFSDIAYGKRCCALPTPGSSCAALLESWEQWASLYRRLVGEFFRLAGEPAVGDLFPALGFLDAIVSRKVRAEIEAYKKMIEATLTPIVDERRKYWAEQVEADERETRRRQRHDPALSTCDALLLGKHTEDGEPAPHDFIVRTLHGYTISISSAPWFLEWTMARLLAHPRYLAQLQEEMDRVLGRDRVVEDEDLPHLPLLRAVMMESMRMYPPAPLSLPHCNSQQAATVAGYHVPKGTTVLVNIYGIGRNPKVWPEPHAFQPERFLGRPDLDNTGHHFEMLTYGSGRRMCPASNLMNRVLSLILARCVQCFHWEIAPGHEIDFTASPGMLALPSPATPLLVVPSLRLPLHLYTVHTDCSDSHKS